MESFYCNDVGITKCNNIDARNSSAAAYMILYKLIVVCLWRDRGRWESFNSNGASTFVNPFNYRSRNRHQHLWDRRCVSSSRPLEWFGLNIFISPQLGLSCTTMIPSCGGDSSIHASQYGQYKINWHLYRLSVERLQHSIYRFVPR